MAENREMQRNLVERIKLILDHHNRYVHFFRRLAMRDDIPNCRLLLREHSLSGHQYNLPNASQVAAVIVGGEDPTNMGSREIIVQTREGTLQLVPDTAGYYDPLQYPLLLPFGDHGWDVNTRSTNGHRVSCRAFYSYMLQIRENDTSILLRAGRLLQQYVVDNHVKIEMQKLRFLRNNQDVIRAELYQGLQDLYNTGERSAGNVGRRVILPSSHMGSPRDMYHRYQDAMALVQRYGKPDLFITITCNPSWEEITRELLPGQVHQDRPDLTTRIFRSKLEELKDDIYKCGVLGVVVAHVHVVEFQKRGLPHAHMLVIFNEHDKLNNPDVYDQIVRAEIPDPDVEPELHLIVKKHMIHGPCGRFAPNSPCMKEGVCKKGYPRHFSEHTVQGNDSYPKYTRREDGRFVLKGRHTVDNRWVVPYNPWLLKKYNCHINVEICSSVKSVKYLYKYIHKGPDRISFEVRRQSSDTNDEISQFLDARWVCPHEAFWRIFMFQVNQIYPTVLALQIHLPNMQQVRFYGHELLDDVLNDESASKTMLTAFFDTNKNDVEARNLLYRELPERYRWISNEKRWQKRATTQRAIGRIYTVPPNEGERYYLRILLNHVRGPESFDDLLKIDQTPPCRTFKESAEKRGLLESDNSLRECLLEASSVRMPSSLRRLFVTILLYCQPTGVRELWNEFNSYLIEDYPSTNSSNVTTNQNRLFWELNNILQQSGKSISDFDLPTPTTTSSTIGSVPQMIEDEQCICVTSEDLQCVDRLNVAQKHAFGVIIDVVHSKKEVVFFIDGLGGTGKTFLYRAILAYLRNEGHIALATASSGIAATILPGGRTAHSRFKIPISIGPTSTCSISKQSETAELLRRSTIMLWDEATMVHRHAFEAFDRTLRDITEKDMPFGGKIIIFGGDFRQVLPVVPRGTKSETIDACIVKSAIWDHVHVIHLTENMRSRIDPNFSKVLLDIGDGVATTFGNEMIRVPDEMIIPWIDEGSITQLVEIVFPNLLDKAHDIRYMVERAIMAPTNECVDDINNQVINIFPGDEKIYYSFDYVEDDERNLYQQEFLNSISLGGLPPHRLILKHGAPIILLRNIDQKIGLCNGSRLICRGFHRNLIDAEIVIGNFAGTRVFLPRIPLQPPENINLPFKLIRKQFLVRLCFSMTINKAQGQTIPFAGIYLPNHVFSHGQLYVALSRGVSMASTKILVRDGKVSGKDGTYTKNVVYKEILFAES